MQRAKRFATAGNVRAQKLMSFLFQKPCHWSTILTICTRIWDVSTNFSDYLFLFIPVLFCSCGWSLFFFTFNLRKIMKAVWAPTIALPIILATISSSLTCPVFIRLCRIYVGFPLIDCAPLVESKLNNNFVSIITTLLLLTHASTHVTQSRMG